MTMKSEKAEFSAQTVKIEMELLHIILEGNVRFSVEIWQKNKKTFSNR